ncbi:MAG: ATP-binding cassette domain-containing protein, partial [Erysipelotrichaceae bacterium]|nr:ATP-binding cassette domain-containing protein [Erysipelotrichaceae bacterium]
YDVKEISTKTLFEHISIVFQNVELFNQSILENIRIGRQDATDEEVLVAAKLANVDCFAKKLPDGYHTMIGENGSKLSGGQRQRISIARAFLKNAPIILLDEISSSLDVENEIEIQASINQLIKDKTVIVITHRLKSIEDVDKIVVLNQGRVDSIGTHKELLKTSKLYQNLVKKSELTDQYQY